MKTFLSIAGLALIISLAACNNTTKAGHETNNADTAVLVQDTANKLNAKPINDTAVDLKTK